MTEEVKIEVSNEIPEAQEGAEPQYTEVEQRALEMGWRPKEEFDGSEDDFIDAKEFVRRKPLFDKIEHQSKELKTFRKTLEAFKQHYTAVEKAAVAKAYEQLKSARQEAISNSDGDKFEQIDAEIKQVEKQARAIQEMEVAPAQEEPQVHPEFAAWVNKNSWYNSVSYMRKYADEVGVQLAQQGVPREEVLKKVAEAVKKEFPTKFVNPNKATAPDVESGTPAQRAARSERIELTDQERKIMNTLVASGDITKEKYLADLKKIKGIN
jgi:type II secretory pathway component PulM